MKLIVSGIIANINPIANPVGGRVIVETSVDLSVIYLVDPLDVILKRHDGRV